MRSVLGRRGWGYWEHWIRPICQFGNLLRVGKKRCDVGLFIHLTKCFEDDLREAYYPMPSVGVEVVGLFICCQHTHWTMATLSRGQLVELELINIEQQLIILRRRRRRKLNSRETSSNYDRVNIKFSVFEQPVCSSKHASSAIRVGESTWLG